MGGIFRQPKPPPVPAPDPELARLRAEEQARADQEKADLESRRMEEKSARMRNLRGRRSLLSAGPLGFPDEKKDTLGG